MADEHDVETVAGLLSRERLRDVLGRIRLTHPKEADLLREHLQVLGSGDLYQALLIEVVSVQKDAVQAERDTATILEGISKHYGKASSALAVIAGEKEASGERLDAWNDRLWRAAAAVARSPWTALVVGALVMWFLERLGVSVSEIGALMGK